MFPPIFTICAANAGVKSVFGNNPIRVFPFGSAPEHTTYPYSVWQIIGGVPENYVGNLPDMDTFLVQIDVYSNMTASARSGALALRNAIEPHAHITAWRGESKDQETLNYRYSFDVNFLTAR